MIFRTNYDLRSNGRIVGGKEVNKKDWLGMGRSRIK